MKAYIYFIINQLNGKRYVGQTIRYTERKSDHLRLLRQGTHKNLKLQYAWNKYGEENFIWQKITFDDIDQQELDRQEIYYIEKYNAIEDGYNNQVGGTEGRGRDTRSKLTFEQYCFAYFGNLKYEGMCQRTGHYLNTDSSCISAIKREKSYLWFLEKAKRLSDEEKQHYIKIFEQELDLKNNPPWIVNKTPDDELTLKIICCVSTYGRGIEAEILNKLDMSKGFVYHFVTGKSRQNIKDKYNSLTEEEIKSIGESFYNELGITLKLKKQFKHLRDKYPKYWH